MMLDITEDAFKWLAGATGVLLSFIGVSVWKDIGRLKDDSGNCRVSLSEFKAHVSETYAAKTDLNAARLETKDAVERVHGRLDSMNEQNEQHFEEIRKDIKTLLSRRENG